MSAIAIMADKLRDELRDRGVELSDLACIMIIRSVIDHATEESEKSARSDAQMEASQ